MQKKKSDNYSPHSTFLLHNFPGEHPAAMQHNSASSLLYIFGDSRRSCSSNHTNIKSSFVKKLIYFRTFGMCVIYIGVVGLVQQFPLLVLIQNRFNTR